MHRLSVFDNQSRLASFETGGGVAARKKHKCKLNVYTLCILEEHFVFGVALLILEVYIHLFDTYSLVYSTFCCIH